MNAGLTKGIVTFSYIYFSFSASHYMEAKPVRLTHQEKNVLDLSDKVEEQKIEIKKLREQISQLKGVEVKKIIPPPSFSHLSQDPISKSYIEEDTIADSSQETMHYYYKGLESFEAKKFDQAVKFFSQFVSLNPHHPYADRAQYFVAESAYQNKEYNLALVATNLLESRYPYSVRLPEILNRKSLSLFQLNQKDMATDALNRLQAEFPNHPILEETKLSLNQLKKAKIENTQSDISTSLEGDNDEEN